MARSFGAQPATTVDSLLRTAIAERRLISFALHGLRRRAEPHDYGIVHGVERLFFYQVGGQSRSGPPFGWRWAIVSEMADLELLDRTFGGTRQTPSGRHVHWDALFASVSSRPGAKATGGTRQHDDP
jgi:hypothetical protein